MAFLCRHYTNVKLLMIKKGIVAIFCFQYLANLSELINFYLPEVIIKPFVF